jgi:two-component system phosphate regulon sensor histidine kinase PhoR
VNRLLEAQQIEAGHRQYAFTSESLESVAQEVVAHLAPIAEARGIRIDIQVEGDTPSVRIDRAAIADAIENLVENAIKYSRNGTRVALRIHADGERVCVEVADQGIGIERDELSRIFDKFYRARRGDLQSVRGTGLGLALVKAAAEAHGGVVDVESEPGVGSRFSLKLPA